MVSTSNKPSNNQSQETQTSWRILIGVAIAVVLSVVATVMLTRPAVPVMSMTPLSGLMTLQSMAAESTPYEVALANQKPILIEFYADWCTTCQSMSATVDALHEQYSEQMNFVMLNIDDPQWAQEVANFGASGVPQFTLLNADHQAVETWVGKVPKPIFTDSFDKVLS